MRYLKLFTLTVLFFCSKPLFAQEDGYLEVIGSVLQEGKGLEGADITIMKGNEKFDNVMTSTGGKFIVNLQFGFDYTLVFSKNGSVTKSVLVNTKIPDAEKKQIFSFKFKMDLFKTPENALQPKEADKPVAKLAFSDDYADFDYDPEYSKTRKAELEGVKVKMEAEAKKQDEAKKVAVEKARQDSSANVRAKQLAELKLKQEQEKVTQDSITKEKAVQAQYAAQAAAKRKTEQDSIVAAENKAKAVEAARIVRQNAVNDSIARVVEKSRQDSILAAKEKMRMEQMAMEKARQDSIANDRQLKLAQVAIEKSRQDSIARENEKLRQLQLAQEKARKDSLENVRIKQEQLAAIAKADREKFAADSTAKSNEQARLLALEQQAQAKATADSLAKVKAKEEADAVAAAKEKARLDAIAKAARDKSVADSLVLAKEAVRKAEFTKIARDKFVADSLVMAKEKVRQDSLATVQEKKRLDALAREERIKIQKDSLDNVRRIQEEEARKIADADAQRQAELAEAKRKADAERLKAQQEANAKKQQAVTPPAPPAPPAPKKNNTDVTQFKVDFKAQIIPEGISEESIKESNRNISRTIINTDKDKIYYLKVVYDYGLEQYYKGSSASAVLTNITSSLYYNEVSNFRKILKSK